MGFLELRRQFGVSHEVRWGIQGAFRVAPWKSGIQLSGVRGGVWHCSRDMVGESGLKTR